MGSKPAAGGNALTTLRDPSGFFALMDVKQAAARILGGKADIMTRRSLHPILRGSIEASALQVF